MSERIKESQVTTIELSQESQSIEWKWGWQEEFMKWLCGYANTDGGIMNIGVNDDGIY